MNFTILMPGLRLAFGGCLRTLNVNRRLAVLCALVFFINPPSSFACNVPVFRFALENWPAQVYELEVISRGQIDANLEADLKKLQKHILQASVNMTMVKVDKGPLKDFESPFSSNPRLLLRFPQGSGLKTVLYDGPLDTDVLKKILDSPARRTIAQRLLKGDSAVWLFVDSGDKGKDDEAHARLQHCLTVQEKTLVLPKLTESPKDKLRTKQIELKVAFSILRIAANDPEEEFLQRLLRHTEADLADRKEPMAFPVFGQGKVLYALIGKGINEETIALAAQFLIGKCKCEVQDENPGVSLLMSVDWEAGLEGRLTAAPELPPLTGLLKSSADASEPGNIGFQLASPRSGLWRNIIVIGGVGVIGLLIASWVLLRKS